MKLHLIKSTLALVAAMAATQAAHATYTSSNEDLILSFYEPNDPNVLQVDIGNISLFTGTPSFTSLNLSADLTSVFGASYYLDSNLSFSVIGGNTSTSTVGGFTGKSAFVSNNINDTYDTKSSSSLSSGPTSKAALLYSNYGTAATSGATANSDILPKGTANDINTVRANYAVSSQNGATPEATFGSVLPPTLSLDIMQPNTSALVTDASGNPYEFSINALGVLTYTAAPEPSTYALMFAAAAGLFFVYRRKSVSSL